MQPTLRGGGLVDFCWWLFGSFGKLGVVVFVLISGWFMHSSKFSAYKLIKLVLQVAIFNFLITFGFYLFFNIENITLSEAFYNLAPWIAWEKFWFVFPYILMYACSPFLNICINNVKKNTLLLMIVIGFILVSYNASGVYGNFFWFCVLYLIAAYINKYQQPSWDKKPLWLLVLGFSLLIIILLKLIFSVEYTGMSSLFIVIMSIALIMIFSKMKFSFRTINILSATTFSIYLIHDSNQFRYWLWREVFVANGSLSQAIIAITVVFLGCLVIGLIYNFTIAKFVSFVLDKIKAKLDKLRQELQVEQEVGT